jgi:hypothetical protein
MNSSNQENGALQPTSLLTLQKASSPSSEALELLMGDQWLLERGLWTERAADTLLGYAYMQPGVEKVQLEIDIDEANLGKSPKVTYKIKLEKSFSGKYLKLKDLSDKPGILNKIRTLYIMRQGIPSAGSIEGTIRMYASSLVPRSYQIEVLFEN